MTAPILLKSLLQWLTKAAILVRASAKALILHIDFLLSEYPVIYNYRVLIFFSAIVIVYYISSALIDKLKELICLLVKIFLFVSSVILFCWIVILIS